MISIIVCSVNKFLLEQLELNIKNNIGCDFEFLYIDNTIERKGICEIYNKLAKQAIGDYLCFVHEDVLIQTPNWGNILKKKAVDKTVGVIGFAGSGTIHAFPYWLDRYTHYRYYIQRTKTGELCYDLTLESSENDFKEVAVLDGMFLFCRKEVWSKYPFDQDQFKEFHIYDMDFSLAIAQDYHNFVCYNVKMTHYSQGSLDRTYFDGLILFYKKWKEKLPFTVYSNIFEKKKKGFFYNGIKGSIKDIVIRTDLSNSYIKYYLEELSMLNSQKNYFILLEYILKSRWRKFKNNISKTK